MRQTSLDDFPQPEIHIWLDSLIERAKYTNDLNEMIYLTGIGSLFTELIEERIKYLEKQASS